MKVTTVLTPFLGLLLAATAANAADKFYKWTDEKGITHYSEAPPVDPNTKASSVKVQTKLPSGSVGTKEDEKVGAKKPAADKATKDNKAAPKPGTAATPATAKTTGKYAEKCKQLQANLKTMQEHARVSVTDEKGEARVISQEEKDSQTDDMQREIKAYCQ
jgi:hypothetical protein